MTSPACLTLKRQHTSEVGLRIDAVSLGAGDQGCDESGELGRFVVARGERWSTCLRAHSAALLAMLRNLSPPTHAGRSDVYQIG